MGLDVLHPHSTSTRSGHLTVDIVAVHGLNGDAIRTWTEPKSKKLWLQDFLPASIEGARVMSFRYNAAAAFGNTTATIRDHAGDLLGSLVAHRGDEDETARPIVFIAHSLGGIIVKQALVLAQDEAEYESIKNHTKGIFFFATPHKGSDFANYGRALAKLSTRLLNRPNPMLIKALKSNSQTLLDLTKEFTTLAPNFKITTFYELKPMGVFRSLIVEKESAILEVEGEAPQAVDANHVEICRFGSRDDGTYKKFISRLRSMLPKGAVITSNREVPNPSQHSEPYNKFYEVPHRVCSLFTGRDDISSKLRAKCLPTGSAITQREQKVFVLYGLGGIGKTQICLNFAQEHQERFWGIFFVDVSSQSTAEQSFSKLARSCQVGDDQEAFKKWLATRTEHWLLVLDNADNLSLDISPYFPTGARGTIIITTRNPQHELYKTIGGGSALVDKMGSDEAITLLLKASDPDGNDQSSRSRAQPVVQLLGYLPLAIIPAGALIRQGKYTYEEYCETFAHRRKELLSSRVLQASADYNHTVYTTWEVSIAAIRETAKGEAGVAQTDSANAADALELLNVFAFCYHDDITEEILQEAWDFVPNVEANQWWMSTLIREFRQNRLPTWEDSLPFSLRMLREDRSPTWDPLPFRQAIDVLSKYSLIYTTNKRIALHPLVQSCIRDLLDDESNLQWWTTTLAMLAMATKKRFTGLVKRQRLLGPHLDACLSIRDIDDFLIEDDSAVERVYIILKLLIYDWEGIDGEDVSLLAQKAFEYCKKVLDEDDPWLWQCLESTARLINDFGHWRKTVDILEPKVIPYLNSRSLNSVYSVESLETMRTLVKAYWKLDRTQEALELAEKVYKISKESWGEDEEITLRMEDILARIYYDLGRKDVALQMSQTVSSRMEAAMGENSSECLKFKANLAGMYVDMGHTQEGLDLYHQVLERLKRMLAEDHVDVLVTQHNLACAYGCLGQPKTGIRLIIDALEKGEKSGLAAYHMHHFKSSLAELRAQEAEQISHRSEEQAKIDDDRRKDDEHDKDESKLKSWAKKTIGRK